ncbi:hypothetical protein DFJ74DRAFT_696565 [Hyaloraphidium curvatum]|nr:hypothetical protein DFJ74DRAFT_696565 [Hyaloraphidium curvatum]
MLAASHLALWLLPITLPLRYAVAGVVAAAFGASMLAFGADAFGPSQLVGGYVLVAVYCVAFPFVWFVGQVALIRQRLRLRHPKNFPTWVAAARERLAGVFHPWSRRNIIQSVILEPYAIVPAWARCVRDSDPSETALGHVEGDPECTCGAPRCSAALLDAVALSWTFDLAARGTLNALTWLFIGWTPLFSLPEVWTHEWSIFLGSSYCLVIALFAVEAFAYPTVDHMLLRLEGRVRRRLVRRALAAFLDRARRAVLEREPFSAPHELWGSTEEPYMQLHAELRPRWQQALQSNILPFVYPIFLTLAMILMAASIIIGACIPAWILAILAQFAYNLLRDLWHAALANAEIAAIGELYSSALTETRDLLVAASPAWDPPPPPLLGTHLVAHAAALERYEGEARAQRRRFLGVAVGFGSFRGLLVSLATVAFAAWGLLRGFGVRAGLETVCAG